MFFEVSHMGAIITREVSGSATAVLSTYCDLYTTPIRIRLLLHYSPPDASMSALHLCGAVGAKSRD